MPEMGNYLWCVRGSFYVDEDYMWGTRVGVGIPSEHTCKTRKVDQGQKRFIKS